MDDPIQPTRCARLLSALAAPERLRIVRFLRDGRRNVGEIAEMLGTAPVNASHHLNVLRNAHLIDSRKEGRFVYYWLMPGILEWKARGEQHLRASGLPYTILRPGGLTNDPGGRAGIRFTQGDTLGGGTIPRADVAALAVFTLGNADATGKTFEMASDAAAPAEAWKKALAGLRSD